MAEVLKWLLLWLPPPHHTQPTHSLPALPSCLQSLKRRAVLVKETFDSLEGVSCTTGESVPPTPLLLLLLLMLHPASPVSPYCLSVVALPDPGVASPSALHCLVSFVCLWQAGLVLSAAHTSHTLSFNSSPASMLPAAVEGSMYAFPRLTIPPAAVKAAADQDKQPDFVYCMELLDKTGIVTVPGSGFGQVGAGAHIECLPLPLRLLNNAFRAGGSCVSHGKCRTGKRKRGWGAWSREVQAQGAPGHCPPCATFDLARPFTSYSKATPCHATTDTALPACTPPAPLQEKGTFHVRTTILPPESDMQAVSDKFAEFHKVGAGGGVCVCGDGVGLGLSGGGWLRWRCRVKKMLQLLHFYAHLCT